MKKVILCLLSFCCLIQWSTAQTPKWVEKAKRAVFSVVTYDDKDNILNTGNGFFVTETGVALSDYSLFEGAKRAVILDYEGRQMPIETVMGADDMYDIIKFQVGITEKKVTALPVASTMPVEGNEVYLLPYSTKKSRFCATGSVSSIDKIASNNYYYTLNMKLRDKMVSCPIVTTEGEVFGLAQKASGQDTATICYAVDARLALSLEISPLAYNDMALRSIGIKKALPTTEDKALVFLYMASTQMSTDNYKVLLNDFISQYPDNPDGYIRRATIYLAQSQDEASMKKVNQDMETALEVAEVKDDVYYNRAKMMYAYLMQQPTPAYKEWTYDKALEDIKKAVSINHLPIYVKLEGDIQLARQDYPAALTCYQEVNRSNLVSAATLLAEANVKSLMQAPSEEVLALLDSCMNYYPAPYTQEAAPYLLARAQALMNADRSRDALADYDAYYKAVNGNVNDAFYYYREQAALKGKQYQRALDDINKAIELNPKDLLYKAELAVLDIRVGRSAEAIKVLEETLTLNPDYSEAYRLMGLAHVQLRQEAKACECFKKAKELGDPNVDALIEKYCK